jgi:hypothetical protein
VAEISEASVEVPTAMAGFLLVLRLHGTASMNTQDPQGGWSVRVPVSSAAAVETLLDDMRPWLRQEGIAETSVRFGDDVYRVGARSGRFAGREADDEFEAVTVATVPATVEATKSGSGLREAPSLPVHQE